MRRLPLLVLAAALACTSEVTPQNPYDPATPLPLQAKARVIGTVETSLGTPYAGLDVFLRKNGQLAGSFKTDPVGAFLFDSLTPGSYAVDVKANGFSPMSVTVQLAAGADIDVGPIALSPIGGVTTGTLKGSAVLGRVQAGGGLPVPDPAADNGGILIESVATAFAAVTTSSGEYALSLPPGLHTLRVSHPNYIAFEVPNQEVTLGGTSPVLQVVLANNPAKVTGTVLAEQLDGSVGPLADAFVTLDGTSATGFTNAAGQFTLDQLAPGSYLLRVLKDGYATASAPVLDLVGGEDRLLAGPLSLTLLRGGISGQVVLADTPTDASGVVVEVSGSGRAVVTGADGLFAFDGLVSGAYEVRARREGYAQQVVTGLSVTAGAVQGTGTITLTRQGGTVAISEGAVTRARAITLQLGAPSAASFRASEDPTFQDPALGDTAGTQPYGGPGTTAGFTLSDRDGAHQVYVVFIDATGGASAPASASIVLDRLAPAAPEVVIETGGAYTRTATVRLTLSAQDLPATAGAAVSGLAKMELADNSAFTGSVLLDYNLAHTWTLSTGDGLKAVYARFHDRAQNVSAPATALVTLDTQPPQVPSILLSGGAGAPAGTTGSPLVTATLSATDANEGSGKQALQVRISNASGGAGATWQPYAASMSWLLPPGDGAKTVFAQFMDPAGNQSQEVQASITLAGTAPTAGSVAVAGGAAATNQQVVPATISATGATAMRLFVDGAAVTGWIPYATSATVDLGATPGEATRLVSVSFRNAAGVEGGAASDSIVFDQRAPTAPSIALNGGAAFTKDLSATLTLSALDAPAAAGGYAAGLDTVELADNALFTGSTTIPYAASATWVLTGADGTKGVWARFRDRAGNVSAAATASIALDTAGPTAPAISLAGNAEAQAGATGTAAITATLSATDANEGVGKANLQVRLSPVAGFAGAAWQSYAGSLPFTLPAGDGLKTVYAQFRDAAGNVSLAVSATITLAAIPPSAGAIVVEGGASATRKTTVDVALSASGAAQMRLFVNGVAAAGWIPYAASTTVALGAAPDEATRAISVAFRSAGGLEGGSASTSILLDQRAPTAPAVTVNGGAAFAGGLPVTLALSAQELPAVAGGLTAGLDTVEVSNDAAFATSTVVPMVATLSWSLAAGADGPRTVYARFKDKAGNASAVASAPVALDTAGPTAPAISLSGGAGAQAGATATPVVTATLSATDANEGAGKANLEVRLGNDAGFSGSTWQPYATSLSWVLTAGDGAKTVYAQFRDKVGNVSLPVSAGISLASTPPSGGSLVLAAGAAATNQASVSAAVLASGAAEMRFYVNGAASGGWIPYATSATVALGATPDEAARAVAVAFRNAGGVEGGGASTTILFDQKAPTGGAVSVNGGAAYAGTTAATLTVSASDGPVAGTAASGLASVEVSNDAAFAVSTTFPYATSLPWTLATGADGARTVHVRFRDKAGNVSASVSDGIALDATGPTAPSISLAGNAGAQAGSTGTPVVTATLSATDVNEGAGKANLEVRLSNDPGFAGATWQPYATTLSWSLPGTDGLKTVYAQFRDAAGNLSVIVNGTITLAATPPSAGSITVAGGVAATNLSTVSAAVSATGASQMQFYVNGVATGGWVAYAPTGSVALGAAPDEATRTVAVSFRNAGGVEGGGASTTILFDQKAPTAPSVVVNGGAAYAATGSVTLALSASDGPAAGGVASGLASVEVANNAAFTASTTYPMTDSVTWALAAGADGPRAVHARFRDRAGNLSATASAGIVLDATGPTAPSLTLAGNPEAQAGYTGTAVVTATLSATDVNEGAAKANLQVRLSNDSGFAGASWQPYATSLPWVLQIGDGAKTVYAQFRDAAGNLSTIVNAPITLDATPPTGGAVAVAGGAAATNQPAVTATISAAGAAQMQLYVNGAAAGGWIPYAGTAPVALGASPDETTRTVSVVFRNFGGVEGGAAITSILLDQAAPVSPSVVVAGGAAYAADTAVTLTLSASDGPTTGTAASGLDTVEVANNAAFTSSSTYAYATSLPWTLALGADGPRTVHVRFKDKAGNVSAAASDGITLDVAGPTAPSISLAGNATAQGGYTGTPVVTATLSATDVNEGIGKANLQVRVANDSGFSGASWQPYTTAMPWVLPIGDGSKTVYAQFRDAVGNVSLPVNASITLAETPPSAGTIAVAGGAPATNQQSVLASLLATGAARMQLYVNGVAQPGGFVAYATSALLDLGLTPDESTRTVSVVYRNAGGVEGGDALTTIVMDRTAPTSPSVLVNGGASWTSPTAVTLAVSAQDGPATGTVASGLASVEIANNPAFTGSATFAIADTVPWTLLAGEGAKTVYARFRDKAGNISASTSDGIILDTLGPTSPTVSMVGNTEASGGYTGTPVVTLTLSATDVNEGSGKLNLQVRVANDVGFSGVNWQPYTTSMQWVLPTGDGTKTVYAQFKDGAGNASATTSAAIQLLATPPSGGSIVLASGATATAASSVVAAISASNAATMRLSVNGVAVTGWIPYATGTSVSLAGVPDQSTAAVTVSFRNLGGVEGGAATDSIRFDQSAPAAGALAITGTLGNGTTSTTMSATPAVTLSITPPGGDEVEMAVAQTAAASLCSGAFVTPLWQPVSRSASLVLSGVDGAKRACVVFRDAAGNWTAANAAAANVTLDTTPPTNPTYVNLVSKTQNAPSAPSSGLPQVTASTDATSGGVFYQCTGGTGTRYGASWVDCGAGTTLPFAYALATNAQSTLGVRARDAAYNYSPGSFVQILHDDVAPFPPFITDLRSSRDSVTVTWDASGDTDVVDFLVYYGDAPGQLIGTGAAQGPSPVSVGVVNGQATQSFTLTGLTQGLPYYLAIEAVDAAGNRSGKGGERSAVPAKANPRVLSTFAGEPRTLAMKATTTKTFLYFAENQGVVQFDASADGLTAPTGRVYIPDVVPDEAASLPVFDCTRSGVAGHCLVVSGTTAEGDYRNNHAAYRAPAHVVYFPLTGTVASPVVGSIEAVLPVRPLRTAVATVLGEPVIFAFHGTGMQAYTFKSGKLAFLKKVIDDDPGLSFTAVHAAEVNGSKLWVFSTSPDWSTAPFLYSYDITNVLSGLVGYAEYGCLFDANGAWIGDAGAQFAVDLKGGVYTSVVDPFTDTTVAYRYAPGVLSPNATIALPSDSSSNGAGPTAITAGLNGHHYFFESSGMGPPEAYQVLDSGSFTYLSTVALQNDAVTAVAGGNHLGAERLMVLEGTAGNRGGERFSISGSVVTHLAGADFSEVQTDSFAEIDRFLYFANGASIRIAEAANPFSPQLVKVFTPAYAVDYTQVVAHGRFLYALSRLGRVDVYRANPDGSITLRAATLVNASAVAVVGRWLFVSSGTIIYAFNTTNVATGTLTLVTSLSSAGFTVTAMDARFRNASPGLAQGGAGAPVPQAVIYAVSASELRTFAFDGVTLSALGGPVAVPNFGAEGITVAGDYAAVSTPTGTYRATVSSPAFPSIATTLYPISGATLLQAGYMVGLGTQGDPSGPVFAGLSSNTVDGAIRYSVCAGSNMGGSQPSSLTHVDGRYAASCGRNGVTLFTPVASDGGRLLKSSDISPTWNTNPVAPLASDGMVNRLAGPLIGGDYSRMYTSSEQFVADGSYGTPSFTAGNVLGSNPPNLAFAADVLRYAAFMTQVDGALYVVTGRFFGAPTVDVYDVGANPWTYMGRYTFTGTTQPSAIATDGEYLYVARNSPGTVEVLDIRNPVSITLRATIAASGGLDIGALALARDRLYVGPRNNFQVRVYDVSGVQTGAAILAKTPVSLWYFGDFTGLAVSGGALFATQAVANDPTAPFKLYSATLGAVDRDGLGAAVVGFDTSVSPLRSPVVAGDVLYVASNQGTAVWDLADFWRSRLAPVPRGGANLADPFTSAPVSLRIDGPFASLLGGVYRLFDLR